MTQDINVATLVACGIHPTQARQFEDALSFACAQYQIDTPARIGGFIGQLRVESDDFTELEENLYYTNPQRLADVFPHQLPTAAAASAYLGKPRDLALLVYSDRLGNGPASTGDGWTFRGQGLIQLTGRGNVADAATALGKPYLEQPAMLQDPAEAALIAAWFWAVHHCNDLADAAMWDAITRAINGPGMQQAQLRAQYSQAATRVFS